MVGATHANAHADADVASADLVHARRRLALPHLSGRRANDARRRTSRDRFRFARDGVWESVCAVADRGARVVRARCVRR